MGNASVVGVDEAKLWSMADALRNNMDAAEYKHVVLGLIFLKYISDAFEARYEYLRAAVDDPKDEYFLRPDDLAGTTAILVRTSSRFCWAALTNTRRDGSAEAIDDMMWDLVSKVSAWRKELST